MARGRKRADVFAHRLVIMAKAPIAGTVKRRLARDIGNVAALRFYRGTLARTLLSLGGDRRWRSFLAVTPDTAQRARFWPACDNIVRIPQGQGGLGTRMQRLFDDMPPGPVIIVGSDIPAVRPAHIARAFKLLGHADAVFGPAQDGGYWLVGFKRSPKQLSPFERIPWSTDAALAATLQNLRGHTIAFADTLSDVDRKNDYDRERRVAERMIGK